MKKGEVKGVGKGEKKSRERESGPISAGNGGLRRGLPCLPSRLSINAYTWKK